MTVANSISSSPLYPGVEENLSLIENPVHIRLSLGTLYVLPLIPYRVAFQPQKSDGL